MPGKSFKTSIVGYILIASSVLALIGDTISKQGIPNTFMEWFSFGTAAAAGVGALLAKDYDVSNSQHPAAPTVVPPTLAVTPNPAAAVK